VSAIVLVVVLALDFVVLIFYGLRLFDATLMAEGDFALPVVGGVAAIGGGYAFFRRNHPDVHLFGPDPTIERPPTESKSSK
jgi:hypothetical protein